MLRKFRLIQSILNNDFFYRIGSRMVFDYDYIVIGAGINGAWTGYHLAKLNQKTLIIEQVSKLKENICLTIFTFGILYA